MIGLLSSPWLLRIVLGAAIVGSVWFGLNHWKKAAVEAAVAQVHAQYKAAADKALEEAKESANEVQRLNQQSRDRLAAAIPDDARRLRDKFTAGLPAVSVCARVEEDQRGSVEPRKSDQTEARFEAASEAIAELSAALKACGEGAGNVAGRIK